MFNTLSFINEHSGACSDYHSDGVYNTFIFVNGRCYEWNDDHAALMEAMK